jgi:hypothetical protein
MGSDNDWDAEQAVLREYEFAASQYAWAVAELNRQRATLKGDEYRRIFSRVEWARAECEKFRSQLEKLTEEV